MFAFCYSSYPLEHSKFKRKSVRVKTKTFNRQTIITPCV